MTPEGLRAAPGSQGGLSAYDAVARSAHGERQGAVTARGWRGRLQEIGRWAVVVSLFCVPLNKPATSLALGIALLCSLLAPDLSGRLRAGLRQPVVRGALVWMGVLALSALHSGMAHGMAFPRGSTLLALAYPLLVATLLDSNRWRGRAVLAFCIAVTAVLLISWGQSIGIVPQRELTRLESGLRLRNTVFKEYTQQGLTFLILASFAFAALIAKPARRVRWVLAAVVLLATANVLFLIDSRTALITIVMVMAYFAWRLLGPRNGPGLRQAAVLAISLMLTAAVLWSVPVVRDRVIAVHSEILVYASNRQPTSTGIRIEMWRHTVPMIEASPLWGHGLNRWGPMYREAIRDLPDYPAFTADHPHQEYLWILAEEGVAGLLVFIVLMVALARHLARLQPAHRDAWACLMIVYLTAGLANCLWFDFSHRHVFILLLACLPLVTPADDGSRGVAS